MQYFVYDDTTGVIVKIGLVIPAPVDRDAYDSADDYDAAVAAAKSAALSAQASSGQTAVEGVADPKTQKWDVTDEELVAYTPPATVIDYDQENRTTRNAMLRACDWTQLPDSPLTSAKKTEWQTYRQDLRDLPEDVDTFSTAYLTSSDLPSKPD